MRGLWLVLALSAAPLAVQAVEDTAAPERSTATLPAPDAAAAPERNAGEPRVERIVIEGENARIDELRVRGRTLRIVVTPKNSIAGFGPRYEILTGDGSSDLSHDPTSSRGAAGQRVWHLMRF